MNWTDPGMRSLPSRLTKAVPPSRTPQSSGSMYPGIAPSRPPNYLRIKPRHVPRDPRCKREPYRHIIKRRKHRPHARIRQGLVTQIPAVNAPIYFLRLLATNQLRRSGCSNTTFLRGLARVYHQRGMRPRHNVPRLARFRCCSHKQAPLLENVPDGSHVDASIFILSANSRDMASRQKFLKRRSRRRVAHSSPLLA